MSTASEFLKYSSQLLEAKFRQKTNSILGRVISKKNLNEASTISDIEEYINLLESSIAMVSGQKIADSICRSLRDKAMEFDLINETAEIRNTLNAEPLDINVNDFLARINAGTMRNELDKIREADKQQPLGSSISIDIDKFLMNSSLPKESEIARHSAELATKCVCDAETVKKEIIKRAKDHFQNDINKKAINVEINKFLFKFPLPTATDIDDFVIYINLLKLNCPEAELKEQVEIERLYHKFQNPVLDATPSEIDRFINLIKLYPGKDDLIRVLNENEFGYLIKDETGVSDKLLNRLIELIALVEKDHMGGLYLKP